MPYQVKSSQVKTSFFSFEEGKDRVSCFLGRKRKRKKRNGEGCLDDLSTLSPLSPYVLL